MKKFMILLSLLPAFLLPGRAQSVPVFTSGAEYRAYVEELQRNRAETKMSQEKTMDSRRARVAQLAAEAEAETDEAQKQLLLDRVAVENRMVGEVWSRYQDDLIRFDQQLQEAEERYKFVFEEAFPYYRDREQYTKDEWKLYLKQASREIKRSETGKALKQYIKTLP